MFKTRNAFFSTPVILAILSILSYALLTPGMGFYWDDWTFAWIAHAQGPWEFIPAMGTARPFAGPLYAITSLILQQSPLAWQLFGVLTRYLSALSMWWALTQIWPSHRRQVAWVSIFFLVFPGFGQQWIALTYANQALVPLCFFALSLGVMAKTARTSRHFWRLTALALLLQIGGLFPTEYYYGLELLRPLILWIILAPEVRDIRQRSFRALRLWLPYLALFVINTLWLYIYQRSAAYNGYPLQVVDLMSSGVKGFLVNVVQEVAHAIAVAGFASWAQTLAIFTQPLDALSAWLTIAIVLVCLPAIYIFLNKQDSLPVAIPEPVNTDAWAYQAIILGIVGMLSGRLPSWAAGLSLRLEFSWDRFLLSMILGASLFFVGMLEFLLRPARRKVVTFSLFIALAVGWQFNTANTYRRDWENQSRFFWQLAWRMPRLEPGTLLLTQELPFWYETDYSLSAAVNWIYAPDLQGRQLPYMLAYTKTRFKTALLPGYELDQPINYNYRTFTFSGTTSQAVAFNYVVPGCLLVLDPLYSNNATVPNAPYTLTDVIPLSDPARWVSDSTSPARPPQSVFGSEPTHDWCYYFEKADLARQTGDWEAIPALETQASQGGFTPRVVMERLPFIEGAAHTGDLQHAEDLTLSAYRSDPGTGAALCAVWQRLQQTIPSQPVHDHAASVGSTLGCSYD